ncbi:MAG TPA: DUF1731 domain-containing protein [Fimbriimonadaceae bacterium]|nr:DUF1731 domain-containing protein [Fimbriimonadaceae bacterium]
MTLSRREGPGVVAWDGRTLGPWVDALEGADAVINLAGRSVNCRYNPANLKEMMDSRVESTRVIGEAISRIQNPPRVWLQSSTATIYAHRFDAPNDEVTGILGSNDPTHKWAASIIIAQAWEAELDAAPTPSTRKVAMRSAMTMSIDSGSIFDVLSGLTRKGLGGTIAGGKQYVSWIHETDFCRAVSFLLEQESLAGPVNLASPNPLPQRDFARILAQAWGARLALPATAWMIEIATRILQTESELVLKSRRVVPTRLLDAGFQFTYPTWEGAANDLVSRMRRS